MTASVRKIAIIRTGGQSGVDRAALDFAIEHGILPSSVHEILLLADDGSMSAQELSAMVSAVNSQEVMPEEQLGSEAYHYDAQAQVFEKASAYEERIMEDREMIADAMPGVVHVLHGKLVELR